MRLFPLYPCPARVCRVPRVGKPAARIYRVPNTPQTFTTTIHKARSRTSAAMIKRTYSRRALDAPVPTHNAPSKRRRVDDACEAAASSPSSVPAIFSDEREEDWTPPSSPDVEASEAIFRKHGVLKSTTAAAALSSSPPRRALHAGFSSNTPGPPKRSPTKGIAAQRERSHPYPNSKLKLKPKSKPKPLTQMRLDLGQLVQKRCQTCGMEYRPSVPEDQKLHSTFHSQNVDGIAINAKLRLQLQALGDEGAALYSEEVIQPVDVSFLRQSRVRKLIHEVLGVVETELGGVGIGEDKLLEQVDVPRKAGTEKEEDHTQGTKCDRYKTFLFIRKDKILGVCLAERIFEAFPVLEPEGNDEKADAAITTSEQPHQATLGISRIWVSKCARGQGIAQQLLGFAAKRFIYHFSVPKEQIAFSQPTESGARLARKWFGREGSWLVYPG